MYVRHLSDVLVSRNWYKTMSKLYQNVYIYEIMYKIRSIKQIIFNNYATNLKTKWSSVSVCIPWPVYCTLIGWSSCDFRFRNPFSVGFLWYPIDAGSHTITSTFYIPSKQGSIPSNAIPNVDWLISGAEIKHLVVVNKWKCDVKL